MQVSEVLLIRPAHSMHVKQCVFLQDLSITCAASPAYAGDRARALSKVVHCLPAQDHGSCRMMSAQ
jgi:hypothetical protein